MIGLFPHILLACALPYQARFVRIQVLSQWLISNVHQLFSRLTNLFVYNETSAIVLPQLLRGIW